MRSCPLCSASVAQSSLEAHLRVELAYPEWRCLLCPAAFAGQDDVGRHFSGPLAKHKGASEQVMLLPADEAKESRLVELLRLADGGAPSVEARLCVCGRCRLPCRQDLAFPPPLTSPQDYASRDDFGHSDKDHYGSYPESQPSRKRRRADSPAFAEPQPYRSFAEAPEAEGAPDQTFGQPKDAASFRVKAELEDVKPELAADGKVACLLCGLRVGKDSFKKHALGAHMSAKPFQCGLCPLKAKLKSELAKHQKKEHETALSSESFLFTGSGSEVERTLEECFGSVKDIDWARVRCKPCDKLLNKMNAKTHIAQVHIKKPLHSCLLCDYTSLELSAGKTNAHVKKAHGAVPGPETIDSAEAQHYAPIVKSMMDELLIPQ